MQRMALQYLVSYMFDQYDNNQLHHGDCIGADEEAAMEASDSDWVVIAHPPTDESRRAFSVYTEFFRDPKPFLDRNKDIVDECDLLIAAPKGPETQRSGTWSTVRYARRIGKPVIILDGS